MTAFFVPHDLKAPLAGAADGPLAGLTAAVKDMYDIAGERTGGGNPDWLRQQKPAERHAGAVARLLEAGATIVGKTICDEFFYSVAGANAHYGAPANLRAPGRSSGGSSSGPAAATAAAAVAAALRAALDRMRAVLPKAEAVTVAPDGFDPWREAFRFIQARETWATFGDFITRHRPDLGPGIKERMALAATVSEADTKAPRAVHAAARARMHALLPPGTVLALPTTPSIAPLLNASGEDVESF